MWIKTQCGYLVNVSTLNCIWYSKRDNETRGYVGKNWYVLSEGDSRAEITTAMRKGLLFLSLGGVAHG